MASNITSPKGMVWQQFWKGLAGRHTTGSGQEPYHKAWWASLWSQTTSEALSHDHLGPLNLFLRLPPLLLLTTHSPVLQDSQSMALEPSCLINLDQVPFLLCV